MPAPARRTLIYVEDQPVKALLMAAIVERRPALELVIARTGEEALCLAAGLNPALLVVNLSLPDCDGARLLALLRALPGCGAVPAVAVTPDVQFDVAVWGFTERWHQPLAVDDVLARLDALLGTTAPPEPVLPRELMAS